MHCELVVPGLFASPSATRLPSVELLLARGRSSSAEAQPLETWLQEAFGVAEAPPGRGIAAGALTLLGAGREPAGFSWARADPVHLQLMRDHLVLVPGAALALAREEAQALVDALNRHFAERLELELVDAERWVAKLAEDVTLNAEPALARAGGDITPARSAPSSMVAALLNEAQMVLHAHPVNEAREARGALPVNSLWFWGAGRAPRAGEAQWQSVSAAEPLALGLARAAGIRHRVLEKSAHAWLERMPQDGRHLVVLDQLRVPLALGGEAEYADARARLEHDWFAPLLATLRAGRIGMVTIHVPDASASASYETIRGDLRRFWRRPKSLEKYA